MLNVFLDGLEQTVALPATWILGAPLESGLENFCFGSGVVFAFGLMRCLPKFVLLVVAGMMTMFVSAVCGVWGMTLDRDGKLGPMSDGWQRMSAWTRFYRGMLSGIQGFNEAHIMPVLRPQHLPR